MKLSMCVMPTMFEQTSTPAQQKTRLSQLLLHHQAATVPLSCFQGYIAPLPNGDPFECFARGVNGVLERLSAECSNSTNSTLDLVSAATLQAVADLGLAVASLQPLGSTPWTYTFPFYSIQVRLSI